MTREDIGSDGADRTDDYVSVVYGNGKDDQVPVIRES